MIQRTLINLIFESDVEISEYWNDLLNTSNFVGQINEGSMYF